MELMASRTEKKKKLGAFQSIQLTVKRDSMMEKLSSPSR